MEKLRPGAHRFDGLPRHLHGQIDVPVADRLMPRLLGLALLDIADAGPGLLIPGCRCVHSFGMRFPLQIHFLDREGRPLGRVDSLPPRRVCGLWRAHSVLELVPVIEP